MIKTFSPTPKDITRSWHLVDAKGQILGRLATQMAILLMGKHKPSFAPHLDSGDEVVVVNASQIVVTGNKAQTKVYNRHSGYPGGLKSTSYALAKPEDIIKHAVAGMLPKNKLQDPRLLRLHIYAGDTHPYGQHFT